MRKKIFGILFLTACVFFAGINSVHAKIEVVIDREYEVTKDYKMKVTEIQTVTNKTENLYIPAGETVEFRILGFRSDDKKSDQLLKDALESAKITETGSTKKFTTESENQTAILKFPYDSNLTSGQSRSFRLEYVHPGLVFQNGALLDVYIHAFAPDFVFESTNTKYIYNTRLKIPRSINKEVNFINPTPKESNNLEYIIYNFDQRQLLNQFVWLQLGRYQIYDFKISQKIDPTEGILTGLQNRFHLIIPRDFLAGEVRQKVYFETIEPEPRSIFEDDAGNIFAEFEFFSDQSTDINIQGFAKVERIGDLDYENLVSSVDQINEEKISKYTKSAPYWEVDEILIQQKAQELKGDLDNVYEMVAKTYEYVVDTIDYSDVKRFGLNQRHGALKTLQGGAAVCMEYSDLFLTLMRAMNVPARAVFGYGYDPRYESSQQESHQWVQVFMPGLDEWIDVDVTWGESGDLLIGGDLNHFYTHTAYLDPNTPSMISRYSYGNKVELTTPDFEIQTIESLPRDEADYKTISDLKFEYPAIEEKESEFIFRQLRNRFVAGISSLQNGIDFKNSSQILTLGTLILLFLVLMWILRTIGKIILPGR